MGEFYERLARLHLVWLWLALCVGIVLLSEVTGAGMLDGGFGSALFGLLFLIGAPLIVIGRVGVALTAWAPSWFQMVVACGLILLAVATADRLVTRALRRLARGRGRGRRT
jgi:hypothetical protein